jgi:hypothetical protein
LLSNTNDDYFDFVNVDVKIDGVLCGTTPESTTDGTWTTVTCAGDGLWGENITLYRDSGGWPLIMCGIKVVGYKNDTTGHTQA